MGSLLLDEIRQSCQRHDLIPPKSLILVGVSGGVDSVVLLHALLSLREELQIDVSVATFNHGLRGDAGTSDVRFVEDMARQWGVEVVSGAADVLAIKDEAGLNLEEAARQARYTFLMQTAVQVGADRIAIAHNQDDQAETVLMHIIRGTGMRGLRGMLPITPLSEYHLLDDWAVTADDGGNFDDVDPAEVVLIRPLLDVSRAEIRTYADAHGLNFRQDATNADTTRFRNALRHEVIPTLEKFNPNVRQVMTRLAAVMRDDVDVIERSVESTAAWLLDWSETEPTPETDGKPGELVFIDRMSFQEQPIAVQRGVIRKVLFDLSPGLRDVSFEQTEYARELILKGKTGMHIDLPIAVRLAVGYDEVTIGYGGRPLYPPHLPYLAPGTQVPVDPEGPTIVAGHLKLISYWVIESRSKDLRFDDPLIATLAIPEGARLVLRTRLTGDRFRPFGMHGKSQKLSDTFTNFKVPSYYRDHVPLLTINDEIAWFVAPTANGPQARIAEPFAVRSEEQSVLRLRWQKPD